MLWRRAPQALSQALSDLQPALVPTKSRDIRREAIETLTVFAGLCADQVPQEIVDRAMLLLNSDVELRNELLQLVKARGAGLDFVPFLSQTLEAPDPIGRAHREALNLLLALGADRPPVRESLLRALQHATLHDQIAKALIATLPECAKFLIGPINQHLESGSVVLVSGAALVAVPLGLETVPSLMVALQDKDYHIRRAALNALGSFGREARRATDLLQSNLKNADLPEERIHSWVTLALVDFDLADQAVAFILPFKESDEQYLRHTAVTALARLGPLARNAAPALRSHKTNSVHLSELIQLALTRIESPN